MRSLARTALLTAVVFLSVGSVAAQDRPASQPARHAGPARLDDVPIYLVLKDDSKLIGELAGYDARQVRVRDRAGRILAVGWEQFKPVGCYYLQKRLTDPNSAEVNFRLGHYCYLNGLREDAQEHFAKARRLDPAYAERIRQIYLGTFAGKVELAIALSDPRELEELERREQQGESGTEPHRPQVPARIVKYRAFSPATHARALQAIRAFGEKANARLNTRLRTVETEHFLIFTDWPAAEERPLGEMFEAIYDRLARQFDIPPEENIFLGKMPVFCWVSREDYARFAAEIDGFPVRTSTVAYVIGNLWGYQHMNLFRYPNRLMLEKIAAHECAHAFVNRYRSNIPLEGWLSEGLAEVMAGTLVPRSRTLERVRAESRSAVQNRTDVLPLLRAGYNPPAMKQYPLAATLVDYLLRKDPARFLGMVDQIKGGTRAETALKEAYGLDYEGLAAAWRQWVAANYPRP